MKIQNIKNNKTKTYLVIGLSLVAMLVSSSSLGAVVAQTTEIKTDNNQSLDTDELMALTGNDMPDFGGAYLDQDGILNVHLVSGKAIQKQTDVDRSALLEKHLGKEHLTKGVKYHQAKYTFSDLLSYKKKLISLFDKQLNVTAVGIDKQRNLILIGLEDMNKSGLVASEVAKLNIPNEAVYATQIGKIIPNGHTNKYRPVLGGVQIEYLDGLTVWDCSTGIAADSAVGRVIVTAGHCSSSTSRDHTSYNQNSILDIFGGIGSGITGKNPWGTGLVRYSDSLLMAPTVSTTRGLVHTDSGNIQLSGKQYGDLVGNSVSKSGRTTMDTSGQILQSCLFMNPYPNVPGSPYFSCEDIATYSSADGDSGGTVYGFDILTGTYKWYGIHTAVVSSGTYAGKPVFSPVRSIENDLGTLTIS